MVGSEPTGQKAVTCPNRPVVSFPCRNASGHLSATDPHFGHVARRYFSRSLTNRLWIGQDLDSRFQFRGRFPLVPIMHVKAIPDNHHDKADKREEQHALASFHKENVSAFFVARPVPWTPCATRRTARSGRWGEISGAALDRTRCGSASVGRRASGHTRSQ